MVSSNSETLYQIQSFFYGWSVSVLCFLHSQRTSLPGSGGKESEAHKDNVKPSATCAGTFPFISLTCLRQLVVFLLLPTSSGLAWFFYQQVLAKCQKG